MALRALEKRVLEPLITKHGRSLAALAGWSMPSSRNLWDILKREQINGHDARHIRDIWLEVSSFFNQSNLFTFGLAACVNEQAPDNLFYSKCSSTLILQRAVSLLCSQRHNILAS
jgi:hypothetical protein